MCDSFAAATVATVLVLVVLPLVHGAASSVHEEVAHGGDLETELLRYGHLHLFRRPLGLLEYGLQSASLYVGEDEARLLAAMMMSVLMVMMMMVMAVAVAVAAAVLVVHVADYLMDVDELVDLLLAGFVVVVAVDVAAVVGAVVVVAALVHAVAVVRVRIVVLVERVVVVVVVIVVIVAAETVAVVDSVVVAVVVVDIAVAEANSVARVRAVVFFALGRS